MAGIPGAKARTDLNVAIGYLDRAARRLADVLAKLIAADRPQGGGAVKLVRDRIPELAAATGQPGTSQQATEAEFALWLRAKLLEEAQEAATASPATLVEELGDSLQSCTPWPSRLAWPRPRSSAPAPARPAPTAPTPAASSGSPPPG
jgi:hypothetical protein